VSRLVNSSEGGTAGVTISSVNSGGASGNAFGSVFRQTGTEITYSDVTAAHGTKSQRHVTSAGAVGGGYASWVLDQARRCWFYRAAISLDAFPAADTQIAAFYGNGTGTLRASLWVTSTGALRWKNAAGATIQTTTAVLTAASWARIEGLVAGIVETRLFKTLDSGVPTETQLSAATQNLGGTIDNVRWGNGTGIEAAYYLDDLGIDSDFYLGAPGMVFPEELYVPPSWSLPYGLITAAPAPTTGQLWPRGGS
jgi:hypothetical protein